MRVNLLPTRNTTMKARAICLIDFDIEGGFKSAAEEETKLEQAIANLCKGNKNVVHYQVEMRERRGNKDGSHTAPDISKMKFRQN